MPTYRRYHELSQSPFLLMLSKSVEGFGGARLYVTGEYALCMVLQKPLPKVIEIRSTLTNGEMLALCDRSHYEYSLHGSDVLIMHDDKKYIYNTLYDGSVESDTKTRDFTLNAIYICVSDGKAYDPSDALSHINSGMLKTTVSPRESFSKNPVRILQMVRLCCEYAYYVEDDCLEAAKEFSCELVKVSADMVRNLLFAILMSDTAKAYEGQDTMGDSSPVLRGLLMLRNMDAFKYLIPELEACRGIEQKKRYHIYDVQGHMLHTCAETPPRLYMRVAGLLHDIGKPEAYVQNGGKNMHGHDRTGAMMARNILHRLHCKEEFINKVCRIIAIHMYDVAGIAKVETLRRRFAGWGFRLTQDLIDFRFADVAGSGCPDRKSDSAIRFCDVFEQMQADNTPFSIYELRIAGREIAEIMDLHSGAEINDVKRDLLRICAVHPELNEHSALVRLVTDMKNNGGAGG